MGTDFGDYDGDGRLDLFVTNHELEMHTLFRNLGRRPVRRRDVGERDRRSTTLPFVGFGAAFLDYDNDGDLDLAIVNGHVMNNSGHFRPGAKYAQRKLLFRNDGGGRFKEVGRQSGPGFALGRRRPRAGRRRHRQRRRSRSAGRPTTAARPDLLRNDGGNRSNALIVRPRAQASNRDGIGARVRLTAGRMTQMRRGQGRIELPGPERLAPALRARDGAAMRSTGGALARAAVSMSSHRPPVDAAITVIEGEGVTARVPFAADERRAPARGQRYFLVCVRLSPWRL